MKPETPRQSDPNALPERGQAGERPDGRDREPDEDRHGSRYTAETVVPGSGSGALLALDEPLSFWGGYDAQAGVIVDPRHPQNGVSLRGRTMLMARAKGSSSSSSVLAEAIRNGTGPSAIVMRDRDLIVALGCIVASELYGIDVPIAVVDAATWNALAALPAGTVLRVDADPETSNIAVG